MKHQLTTLAAAAVLWLAALAVAVTVLQFLAYNRQPGGLRLFYDRSGSESVSLRANNRSRGFTWAVYHQYKPVMPGYRTEIQYDPPMFGGAIWVTRFTGYNAGSIPEQPDTEQRTIEVRYWAIRLTLIVPALLLLMLHSVRHQFVGWARQARVVLPRMLRSPRRRGFDVVER